VFHSIGEEEEWRAVYEFLLKEHAIWPKRKGSGATMIASLRRIHRTRPRPPQMCEFTEDKLHSGFVVITTYCEAERDGALDLSYARLMVSPGPRK